MRNIGPCSIGGCERRAVCRELCAAHYEAYRTSASFIRLPPLTEDERFWAKVEKQRGRDACWLWTAALTDNGYGLFCPTPDTIVRAHRWAWENEHGRAFPDRLQADHLCHTRDAECRPRGQEPCTHRRCVRPSHIEPVTSRENTLRGGSPAARYVATGLCANGHPFTPETTVIRPDGSRRCRICLREWSRSPEQRAKHAQRERDRKERLRRARTLG